VVYPLQKSETEVLGAWNGTGVEDAQGGESILRVREGEGTELKKGRGREGRDGRKDEVNKQCREIWAGREGSASP
jgi:hypothetical protein